MCGLVDYVGNKQERCVEAMIEGSRRLEYCSFDSAGLALQIPRSHRARVPALELSACWTQGNPGHEDGAVPWHSSTEQLQQRIEEGS